MVAGKENCFHIYCLVWHSNCIHLRENLLRKPNL